MPYVIAPLSITDLVDVVSFFQQDVSDLFDHRGHWLRSFSTTMRT